MTRRGIFGIGSVLVLSIVSGFVCSPVFADGPVNIGIVEMVYDGSGEYKPWEDIVGAMPGMTYSAIPRVKNNGETIISTRMCLAESAVDADGNAFALEAGTFTIDINDEFWTLDIGGDDGDLVSSPIDVCYKYNTELAIGEMTEPLFSEVALSSDLGNEYEGSTFRLHLYADAAGDLPANPDTGANTNSEPLTTVWYVSLSVGLVVLAGMIAYLITKSLRKR